MPIFYAEIYTLAVVEPISYDCSFIISGVISVKLSFETKILAIFLPTSLPLHELAKVDVDTFKGGYNTSKVGSLLKQTVI